MASSSMDGTVGCWDIHTGAEQLRYKSCLSPSHGLISIAGRFLASSQIRESSTSGSVLYWSWHKVSSFSLQFLLLFQKLAQLALKLFVWILQPQPEVKSFPAEPIKPLVSNREGTYLFGGGSSGHLYLWEALFSSFFRDTSICIVIVSINDGLELWGLSFPT